MGMTTVVSIHSFRGGTGKSNTTANLAAQLAMAGKRVAVVDTDIQSPGIHVLFGFDEDGVGTSLNDYLHGTCSITDAAYDVTSQVGPCDGKLWLVPSSIRASEIARVLREGYDVGLLNDGFRDLTTGLNLDFLLIDTHPGLNEETLLSITISDVLVLIMRPDKQDFQGTAVTVDVARRLEVPELLLVVNKAPSSIDATSLRAEVAKHYDAEVAAVMPLSESVVESASGALFSVTEPDDPWSVARREVAERVSR
jgi:septum site-determining protein MinD